MRAAIVMPAVFGFADGVVANPETTLFSAFGSFAMLVLADFGGAPRRRLVAYVSLAMLGAVLIVLGTVCSQTGWLAVVSMGVVGFMILFGRLLGGYFASGAFAAMLIFILAVGFPGPTSVIPDRLEGWFLASAAGITATMLIGPAHRLDQLRRDAAGACRALADLIDPGLSSAPAIASRVDAAGSAVRELRRRFFATPLRPTRPTGPTEAVAFMVDALEWLLTVASPAAGPPEAQSEPCRDENGELRSAAGAVLRASAENLEGNRDEIPLRRLEGARDTVESTLTRRIGDSGGAADAGMLLKAIEPSIRTRDIAHLTREIGVNALRVIGVSSGPARSAFRRTLAVLRAHATPRSASFRNAFRGAIGLATAVFVIQVASVERGFWVTLATLSVLRSTALGTGATIFQALAGTIAGIAIGGAFVYAIGTDETVLWAVLPFAVFLAAYSSRAMTFGAGQAGFTVTLVVLFNIIVPTGWTIGLVRVEDVAIGCAISLVVGLLFWPRGIDSLVRESLGAAYERAADYVLAATRWLASGDSAAPDGAVRSARTAALAAADRLDDAFRQYMSEPSAQRADLNSLATLVSGAIRVRLGAFSLSTLSPARSQPPFDRCGEALTSEAADVRSWYDALAGAMVRRSGVAPPQVTSGDRDSPVALCVRDALAREREGAPGAALSLLWADQHIDALWRLGAELAQPAAEFAGKPGESKHGGPPVADQ